MTSWTKWIWPGLVTAASLTALAVWFDMEAIERDLTARSTIALQAETAWAQVAVSGRDASLRGAAPDEAAVPRALEALASVRGLRNVTNSTSMLPLQAPYRLTLEKAADGMIVSGFVPTAAERVELLDSLSANAPGIEIRPLIDFARGAPDNLVALAGFGATLFGHLDEGRYEIVDGTVSISGRAVSPEDFDVLMDLLEKAAPKPVSIDIRPAKLAGPAYFEIIRGESGFKVAGHAADAASRGQILADLKAAAGSGGLDARLRVAGVEDPSLWQEQVTQALAIAKELSSGTVRIEAGRLDVKGELADESRFVRLQAMLDGELVSGLTLGTSDIGIRVVSPYVFSAVLSQDSVALSGYLPAASDRDTLATVLKRRLGSIAVEDATKWAGGAPAGFESALDQALLALSRLETGSVRLSDRELTIEGKTFGNAAAAADFARGLVLPEGYTIAAKVEPLPDPAADATLTLAGDACQALLDILSQRNTILFEPGKAVVSADSRGFLERIAYAMRRCGGRTIEIGGHTDSTGKAADNLALSEARARSVAASLVEAGAGSGAFATVGYGAEKPVADNSNEEGRARNRRIEFKVKP